MLEFESVALLTAVIVLITNVVLLTWLLAKVRVQAEELQNLRFQRRYDSRVIARLRETLADQEILGAATTPKPRVGNVGKVLDYAETHNLNRG